MSLARRRAGVVVPAAVFALATLLHWAQGRWIPSPWVLPDELHGADGARSLVHAGREGPRTLYSFATAPLWSAGTATGYALAKVAGAAFVSSAAFPSYALARLVAPARAAAVAALLAVAAPATLYGSAVRPVALGYPLAALGLLLLVRFAAGSRAADGAGAVLSLALACWAWPELLWLAVPSLALTAILRIGWPRLAAVIPLPAARKTSAHAVSSDRAGHGPSRGGATTATAAARSGTSPRPSANATRLAAPLPAQFGHALEPAAKELEAARAPYSVR